MARELPSHIFESQELTELYMQILGEEDIIQVSEASVRDLKNKAQRTGISKYSNAVSSSLLLLSDADKRTAPFLHRIADGDEHLQQRLQGQTDILETTSIGELPPDIVYEVFFVIAGIRALQGYREPAELIVTHIQDLTQRDLSGFLQSKTKELADERESIALEKYTQYVEGFGQNYKPIPLTSPELRGQRSDRTKGLIRESLRRDPTGQDLLGFFAFTYDRYNRATSGSLYPIVYGFRVGLRRYTSALNKYFK